MTVGLRQSATCALITVQEDSPLLPLLQSSGSPAVVLRLHPLSEADVASLAEELISRRTDKVGENRRNAHWSILRVIPKLPIFVRLAAGLPDPLELKLRPSLDALELLIDLVRVSMGGEAFHGEPLDILRTLGQATWDSLDVTPSGAKRLALRFIASPKPKIAEGGDLRPILASEDQFRYKWRHSTFASLACAVAIAEQSSIALAVTLDAQLVGNPELGQLVVWAMALSDARDAAVELLTKDAGTWRDVALERSRLLLRLAIWTAPARWSGGSREGIKNAVATLAAVEPKYLRAVDPRWLEDQKLQARLKATMDRQIELAIEAIRIAATSADMARYAAGRLERYLKDVTYNGLSIDVADALLTSSGEVEVDVGLVAETARVGILDHDCHPNTRIAAIRLCARQHKVFTADDQGRFQALVRRDDLEEGLRFEIASASAGFGNTEYLLSCLSEEERPKLRLLVSAALASRSAVAEERSRAIQVLKQLATADVGETSDTARQLVGQFVGSEPLTKPDAAPAVVAPPSPSLLASAREAANGAESERALGRLLATLPADEIVRNLVTLAEDEQAYDYTRYLAAVLLHRFEPDRREQCARILSAVVRDAHPITAGHAAGALRGLGSSMDGVIRRFRRVGEEAFFAEVAASVLARTGDARALEALAHIASKHGGFANLVPFVASALSGCRFSASESEWLHALEWAEVATRSLIDVDRS
ncbi:hypothetical protein [Geodermatophilus pulveris]|uniref:hypothetical protein n=1 Tax=Geodermatophilus pulveris TaxID=1564159 RepID=UPI00117B51A2|nr:hypothetical protein [Geodermatophilus pulveris]